MEQIEKKQVNIYLPEEDDAYLNAIKNELGITKSDFVHLALIYFRQTKSLGEIEQIFSNLMIIGKVI